MGFFSKYFSKPPDPIKEVRHHTLGLMRFEDDDESWIGKYNEIEYLISYDKEELPNSNLLEYASNKLTNMTWLEDSLVQAKKKAKLEYNSKLELEIEELEYKNIMFYKFKNSMNILAQLSDDNGDRLWRIEFSNENCDGIGCDT